MSVLAMLADSAQALQVLAPHADRLLGASHELTGVQVLRAWRRTWAKPAQQHREYLDLYVQLQGHDAAGTATQVGIHGIARQGSVRPDASGYSCCLELPGASLSYERMPFDRHLPGLRTLLDIRGCTHALSVPALRHLGGTPDAVALVSFRPGQRAVLRISRGPRALYAKVYAAGRHALHAERLAAVGAIACRVPDCPAVPGLLGQNARRGVIWLAELPGRNVGELLADPGTAANIRRRLGDALGHWHRLPPPPGLALQSRAELLTEAGRKLLKLGIAVPSLAPATRTLLYRLRHRLPQLPALAPSLVHGDVHPAQLLMDDERNVGLCDLDELAIGDPERDLAQLCERIGGDGVLDGWQRRTARPLDAGLFAWHLALSRVDRAYRDFSSAANADAIALAEHLRAAHGSLA